MPEKSSYYTGYKDLDERLARLYASQVQAEKAGRPTDHIIHAQDNLLENGKIRDRFIEETGIVRGCE